MTLVLAKSNFVIIPAVLNKRKNDDDYGENLLTKSIIIPASGHIDQDLLSLLKSMLSKPCWDPGYDKDHVSNLKKGKFLYSEIY